MVKTKRKSKKKSVLRKTAKNKPNKLQIFKQKLKKIQKDLVKLNKKYAVKTKKQHYKRKLLKGGATIGELVDKTPSTLPPGAQDMANQFKQSAKQSSNPKFLSELMELIKRFFDAIADFFKGKSTYEEESTQKKESYTEQAASETGDVPIRESIAAKYGIETGRRLSEKTGQMADAADDYAALARQLY